MINNKNLPAYPTITYEVSDMGHLGHFTKDYGLIKRELIAAMCLQGLLSGDNVIPTEKHVEQAIKLADVLLDKLQTF